MKHNKKLLTSAPETAKLMRSAASNFLKQLSNTQLKKAHFEFESNQERYEWNYTPVEREGLLKSDMNDQQVSSALEMMRTGYSIAGYDTATKIIKLENVLGDWERIQGDLSRFNRDPERYWFSVFGDPNQLDKPWSFRVGGHHIGLIATILGNDVSILPLFFGANPSEIKHGENKGKRTLFEEEEWAREIVVTLPDGHRNRAIVDPVAPPDILSVNFRVVTRSLTPNGIPFSQLENHSRDKLIRLIKHYIYRSTDELADNYWNTIDSQGFENTFFAWAGSTKPGEGHYYNIKHDRFLIEYDNTQNQANHIHSVFRDYTHDFGEDILADHYRSAHA